MRKWAVALGIDGVRSPAMTIIPAETEEAALGAAVMRMLGHEVLLSWTIVEIIPTESELEAQSTGNEIDNRVHYLIGKGENIKAIKLFRRETGVGLKAAKRHVDAMRANMHAIDDLHNRYACVQEEE
jgi:hypothetical protein